MIFALNDYVFLVYDKVEDKKKGIITSDVSRQKPAVMVVEAVGGAVKEVKVGMRVIISPFLPQEVKVEGKTIFILKEKEILGILKK